VERCLACEADRSETWGEAPEWQIRTTSARKRSGYPAMH
jgi:hypothetical protein